MRMKTKANFRNNERIIDSSLIWSRCWLIQQPLPQLPKDMGCFILRDLGGDSSPIFGRGSVELVKCDVAMWGLRKAWSFHPPHIICWRLHRSHNSVLIQAQGDRMTINPSVAMNCIMPTTFPTSMSGLASNEERMESWARAKKSL